MTCDAVSVATSSTHRQARVGEHCDGGGDHQIEQRVTRDRGEDRLHTGGLGQRSGGGNDQLQRQHHQAEADGHAPEMLGIATLLGQEDDYADEDQQR